MIERRKLVRRQADREMLEKSGGPRDRRQDPETKEYRHKRRRAVRHNCQVRIALKLGQSSGWGDTWQVTEHPIKGRILDLSAEGCSVFSPQQLDIGQQLSLVIQLRRGGEIRAGGVVRWTKAVQEHRGFASGVEFVHLMQNDRQRIAAFLQELDATIGL